MIIVAIGLAIGLFGALPNEMDGSLLYGVSALDLPSTACAHPARRRGSDRKLHPGAARMAVDPTVALRYE